MVDLGADVSVIPATTWERVGRSMLVKNPFNISLVDGSRMETLGTWKNAKVNMHGLKQLEDFEVIEMKELFNHLGHCQA